MDKSARLLDKECSVGKKEIGTEPKHHQARFGHLARHGSLKAAIAGSIAHDHCCMGTIAMADLLQQGENYGQDDTWLHAEQDNGESCDERKSEFLRLRTANFGEATSVNQFDTDSKYDGGQDSVREEAQGPSEKEEHHQDHGGRSQMGPLTTATRGVHHGGLGRAAVNNEGAATTGGSVGQRETDQIDILTEVFTITESVGARGGGALSEDDNDFGWRSWRRFRWELISTFGEFLSTDRDRRPGARNH